MKLLKYGLPLNDTEEMTVGRQSRRSNGVPPPGYSNSYMQQSSSLPHRPRSEHGFNTSRKQSRASHYSSSPEYHRPMSDYGGTRRESRYSTMHSDTTGDWQYFGPNEVPMQRSTSRRQEVMSPGRAHSDYYGPSSNGPRQVYRSSQSDYNAPTSRRPRHSVGGPLSDYGGSTHSLKIVRKTSTPRNGYMSSSDESYQDGRYIRSNSVPRKSKQNSLMKKTVRRTISRRDSSPTHEPQRIVVQEPKEPERISVFINDEVDRAPPTKDRTRSLGRDAHRSRSLGRDRAPGKVHTIQTLTREKSLSGVEHPSTHTMERTHSSQTMSQPLQVSTTMRKETVTNQQSRPPPITSGHTTLTFSGPSKPIREETYVNKVFQENDQPTLKKAVESFKSGVIQTDDRVVHEPIIPQRAPVYYEPAKPASNDLHKTRITFVRSEIPAVHHSTKIDVQPIQQLPAPHFVSAAPQPVHTPEEVTEYHTIQPQEGQFPKSSKRSKPKREVSTPVVVAPSNRDVPRKPEPFVEVTEDYSSSSEETTPEAQPVDASPVTKEFIPSQLFQPKPAIAASPQGRDEPDRPGKGRQLPDKYIEEVFVKKSTDLQEPAEKQEDTTQKSTNTKISKLVKYMDPPPVQPVPDQQVEEITETTIEEIYAGMSPDRQKTFADLTKTALGRTEQTTGNFFNGDGKSLITEAWHTNRPKTEREIIDEITSKTTSEVVKRSILDGIDYKFVPTHSKELEEIQRKRKEFEAEMERQRKIRDIKAGIRQRIHVDHNEEDLVGDYSMSITDDGQIDMDTVEEHVDLGINENGIAAIAVKVTAERILPVDVDKNLWRKNSVTVTRTIEIDLMRCEETRQLYEKILKAHKAALAARAEEAARQGLPPQQKVTHELDATDTYKIFSALMNVTGEGENEDLGILNLQTNDPFIESSGMAAKHFLSGDYIRDPEEKAKVFGSSKSSGKSANRQEETTTKTTTTTTSSTHGGKGNMFEDLTLNSINPEKIRSERTSEYYKQKMRESPPPDFTSSMFDGRKFSNKFDEDKARSMQSFEHTSEQRSRSPSPVRGMTSNQRQFYEQTRKGMKTPSRSRLYDPRRDVTGGHLDLSPPRYMERTERREYCSNRSTSPSSRTTSVGRENAFNQKQEGEGVLFSERVHGVKQRANEMRRNSELGGSRDSLSHSPERISHEETITVEEEEPNYNNNNAIDSQTRVGRRRLTSRDDLLFGGEGGYERVVSEENEERYHSKARDSLESHRAKMLGHQHSDRAQSKDNYESGYYSDMPTSRSDPPNSDINRMLHDAERYFKKTASEREISRSPEGYYSPRYNKEHSAHRDSEPADYENRRGSAMKSSHHSMRREMDSPRSDDRLLGYEYSERRVQYDDGHRNGGGRDDSHSRSRDRHNERSEEQHYSYRDGSPSVTKSERHVEHHDSYIQAPAHQIFDNEDSYFDDRHQASRHEGSNSQTLEYSTGPSQHAPVSVGDYLNVKARRAKLRKEMSDQGIDSEQAIADRRLAMLGGSRYVPNTVRSQRVVTSSRRSMGGRR